MNREVIYIKIRDFLSNPRISRYSLPVLLFIVILDILLGFSGIISKDQMKLFIWIPVGLECMFIIICLTNITRIIKRYRVLKREGRESMEALQQALEIILPPGLARLAMIEPRIYQALYLSYKKPGQSDNHLHFQTRLGSYEFLVKIIIGICILEILLVSIMVPNRWLAWKILHLILGLWAILWIWADYRAMRLYCHKVTECGICFRIGLRCCQEIHWESIASISPARKSSPAFGPQIRKEEPGSLYLAAGELCNIEIQLHHLKSFQGMIKDIKDIKRIYLSLEHPESFIEIACKHI